MVVAATAKTLTATHARTAANVHANPLISRGGLLAGVAAGGLGYWGLRQEVFKRASELAGAAQRSWGSSEAAAQPPTTLEAGLSIADMVALRWNGLMDSAHGTIARWLAK